MEEQKQIVFTEMPEEKKPKKRGTSKIIIVVLVLLFGVVRSCIKDPTWRSEWYCYKASRIMNKALTDDSTKVIPGLNREVLPLLNKAIRCDENNWRAWALKGGLYTQQWMHLDSSMLFFKRSIQIQETNAVKGHKAQTIYMYCVCARRAGCHAEALRAAIDGTKEFPLDETLEKERRGCVGNYYREVLIADSVESVEEQVQQVYNILQFADTLRQKQLWEEAVWTLSEALKKYPEGTSLKNALQETGAEYCDLLLANSEDTGDMWYLSSLMWNVDRKRALNLRRKCARLGDEKAQQWFKKKGYEWD